MIAQEQHWQLGSSRTASSAVLVVLGLVLLAVPAAGVLAPNPHLRRVT
jgi:hypothetical protein